MLTSESQFYLSLGKILAIKNVHFLFQIIANLQVAISPSKNYTNELNQKKLKERHFLAFSSLTFQMQLFNYSDMTSFSDVLSAIRVCCEFETIYHLFWTIYALEQSP